MSEMRKILNLFESVNEQIVTESIADAVEDLKVELPTSEDPYATVAEISAEYGVNPDQVKNEFERRFGPIEQWKTNKVRMQSVDAKAQAADAAKSAAAAHAARSAGAKAAALTRAEKEEMLRKKLAVLVNALEDQIGMTFPDGDWHDAVEAVWRKFRIPSDEGWDKVWPRLQKQFLAGTGYKDMNEYMAGMWDQVAADAGPDAEWAQHGNPWK